MKDDWEKKLFQYLKKVEGKKFAWKNWNCCNFVDGYIRAVSDYKLIPNNISWSNKKTALEAIRGLGDSFLDAVTHALSLQNISEINKNYIGVGDIVFFKEKDHLLGVCDGSNIIAVSDDGLVTKPMDRAIKVWRIDV